MRLPILFVMICGLVLAAGQAAAQASRGCAVTALEGENARMEQAGTWRAIAPGPLPDAVARIETGATTRLEVTCQDGFVVTIGPESQADLSELLGRADGDPSIVMALLGGIVGIVTPERTEGTVVVRTPVAIAAVRSTAWLVEHDDAVGTAVFVRDGRVTVSNRETAVVLREGEGVTLTRDSTVRPAASWGQARIEQSTNALGLGWN